MPIGERICNMYEGQVKDKSSLQKIFATNNGYKHITFPMVPKEGDDNPEHVVLNFKARFFWEDMPFGCVILKNVAQIVGVPTPHIDKQIRFHQKFMGLEYIDEAGNFNEQNLAETGAPLRFGIKDLPALLKSSLPKSD